MVGFVKSFVSICVKRCSCESVRIVYDRTTGEPRGVAFVDFAAAEDVDAAMRRNGQHDGLCH